MKLSLERSEIPIIAPCGDLPVSQLKNAHTGHPNALVRELEVVHAFSHNDIAGGYDVAYLPR